MECEYPNCKENATYFMCWRNETGKHCGLVCSTHDKQLGRENLQQCGMSPHEAKMFERYLKETEHNELPTDWPEWFRNNVGTTLTEIDSIKTFLPLDMSIEQLCLSPATLNTLRRNGILTVKQLSSIPLYQLMRIRTMGTKRIEDIRKALDEQRNLQ